MEIALFFCSLLLAIGHVVVAYRTSCRERRKLWVYKIDIEAKCLDKEVVVDAGFKVGSDTSVPRATGFSLQECGVSKDSSASGCRFIQQNLQLGDC
ncbi:hypothetical protein NC651_025252 [Populus alba x Populus x berolinensis]|nr:hypothetical protein NC651_025252 [Populus alba x Populus x berolinensis]